MATRLADKLAALTPERRAAVEAEKRRLLAEEAQYHLVEASLRELREQLSISQVDLATALGVLQAAVSKTDYRPDMNISTLANYVGALGGELQLIVKLPGRPGVRIKGIGRPAGGKIKGKTAGVRHGGAA